MNNIILAVAISLTGTVDDKVCYKSCTGHNDDVIKLNIKYHPDGIF